MQSGDIQGALDTMQNNRVKFNTRGLWASKQNQEVNEIYKQCRKTLPHFDTLLTERLCGTTAVTSSLIGALFREIKSTLMVDFVNASSKLDDIVTMANCESTVHLGRITVRFFKEDERRVMLRYVMLEANLHHSNVEFMV